MVSKAAGDDFDDMSPDDHRPTIEFSTTSYAVLELEQRVDLKIKRRGPIDVDVRFRCLAFAHLCMHCIRTYLLSNSIMLHRATEKRRYCYRHCCCCCKGMNAFEFFSLLIVVFCIQYISMTRERLLSRKESFVRLDLRTSCQTSTVRWEFPCRPSTRWSQGHPVEDRHR